MEITELREWLIPVATAISLLIGAVAAAWSLREFGLKAKAEARLAQSAQVEGDVKLLTLFVEIMDMAHGRGGYQPSEKAIERALADVNFGEIEASNIRRRMRECIVYIPVGIAGQDAAIAAIWALGKRHRLLLPVAVQALLSINHFKGDVSSRYLADLRQLLSNEDLSATEDPELYQSRNRM